MTSTSLIPMAEITHKWFPKGSSFSKRKKNVRVKEFNFDGISTVSRLLKSGQAVPSDSLLLGRCSDGLPFFMEMKDPDVGAILIGCDPGSGKTHQLQVMTESVLKTKAPGEIQIHILTSNPAEWNSLLSRDLSHKFFKHIDAWYDQRAEENIKALADLVESRRERGWTVPNLLLILDDLDAVEDLSYDAQFNLRYLLEYGSQSNVWVVATINTESLPSYAYWVETFRTKIVGRMRSPGAANVFSLFPESGAKLLEPGEFRVWAGDQWLTYSLPLLGG